MKLSCKLVLGVLMGAMFVSTASAEALNRLGMDSLTVETKARTIETDYINKLQSMRSATTFESNLKLREKRKMGFGAAVGGTLGAFGINFELNIEDADGAVAGFGLGDQYNSFQLAWKHSFAGDYLSPYFTAGYSRWFNSDSNAEFKNPKGILGRVLTVEEKLTGQFGADFLNLSLGLQYNQLSGDFNGVSIFGELTAMYEVNRSMVLPNGSVGAVYYF